LNWTAVPGATSYIVKRAATSGAFHTTIATGVSATTYMETISASTYYVVSAVNATGSGEGRDSNEVSVIVAPVLDAPVISASYASGNYAVISWQPVPGATSYNVKRASTSGGPYTTATTGLMNTYYFEMISAPTYYIITGVYAGGEGLPSQEVLITPPLPPITEDELRAPLLVLAGNAASISLTTSIVGRTYQLQRSYTLAPGSWSNLGPPKAGGGALNFSDTPDPTQPAAFYRIFIGG